MELFDSGSHLDVFFEVDQIALDLFSSFALARINT